MNSLCWGRDGFQSESRPLQQDCVTFPWIVNAVCCRPSLCLCDLYFHPPPAPPSLRLRLFVLHLLRCVAVIHNRTKVTPDDVSSPETLIHAGGHPVNSYFTEANQAVCTSIRSIDPLLSRIQPCLPEMISVLSWQLLLHTAFLCLSRIQVHAWNEWC